MKQVSYKTCRLSVRVAGRQAPLSCRVTPRRKGELVEIAKRRGKSVSWVCRRALLVDKLRRRYIRTGRLRLVMALLCVPPSMQDKYLGMAIVVKLDSEQSHDG